MSGHPCATALLLLVLAAASGCAQEDPRAADPVSDTPSTVSGPPAEAPGTAAVDPLLDELERARELWERSGPSDYTYSVTVGCDGCPHDSTGLAVTIESGEVTDVDAVGLRGRDRREANDAAEDLPLVVEDLFDVIERGIAESGIDDAEFDEGLGHPTVVAGSPGWTSAGVRSLRITDLTAADDDPAGTRPERGSDDDDREQMSEDLGDARAKWDDAEPESYRYILHSACFCPTSWGGPFDVTVEDGEIVDVDGPEGEDPQIDVSIDALFDTAEDMIDRADSVTIRYDAEHGFPTEIDADVVAAGIDDEQLWTVREFTEL